MKTLLLLALSGASGLAAAQTPAVNPMPDGSRDMYVGLGASVQPRYEGAREHRTRAAPLLQVEFSNGVFLSGMSAGWHLSEQNGLEFGPLLAVHAGRDESGVRVGPLPGPVTGVSSAHDGYPDGPIAVIDPDVVTGELTGGPTNPANPGVSAGGAIARTNRLQGQPNIKARLTGGAFFNYYLTARIRLNNSVLYGAGGDGLAWEASVQSMTGTLDSHHRVSLLAGLTVVNRAYNTRFFGVRGDVARANRMQAHQPDGGVKDVFVGVRWNWALSPSWMVSTSARASRLQGDARKSPLVERASQFSISTGLAHRF